MGLEGPLSGCMVQIDLSREFGKSVDWLLTGKEKK
jgi:hypothetical protein